MWLNSLSAVVLFIAALSLTGLCCFFLLLHYYIVAMSLKENEKWKMKRDDCSLYSRLIADAYRELGFILFFTSQIFRNKQLNGIFALSAVALSYAGAHPVSVVAFVELEKGRRVASVAEFGVVSLFWSVGHKEEVFELVVIVVGCLILHESHSLVGADVLVVVRENCLAVAVETFDVAAVDDHFLYAVREVAVELISVRKLVVYTFAINFHGFCSVNVASHAAF